MSRHTDVGRDSTLDGTGSSVVPGPGGEGRGDPATVIGSTEGRGREGDTDRGTKTKISSAGTDSFHRS